MSSTSFRSKNKFKSNWGAWQR